MSQQIIPNLWFDGNAETAVNFYTAAFPGSRVNTTMRYPNTVEEGLADFQLDLAGQVLTIDFNLSGQPFVAINAGPEFVFNPSISFMVNFEPAADGGTSQQIDELWEKLVEGGEVLMPLDQYPFSQRYGWVKDRFGLSWQLITSDNGRQARPFIMPSLMFAGDLTNQADEAIEYYTSVFNDSQVGAVAHYPDDTGPAAKGAVMYGDFKLRDTWFAIMDSGVDQPHRFNEAVSFVVSCKDQAEIDYYWERLSAHPENEQCGWCKDKFGLSWQIVPENMVELLSRPGGYQAMMQMKKLIIADF